MVELDRHLLHNARRIINGANVHRVKELIFAYKQAVDMFNSGWVLEYHSECELALRDFVAREQAASLTAKSSSADEQLGA